MPQRPGSSDTHLAALVRPPSPALATAELTHLERVPVHVALAHRQHAGYVDVLRSLGVEVHALPPAPAHPDGMFVEDVLVVVDRLAVITRPGAPSRRGETADVPAALTTFDLEVARIEAPATLDGGDVLQIGDRVYVGRSTRTDDAAIGQLRRLLEPWGRTVVPVDVTGALHLKTAVTALPDGGLVACRDLVDVAPFGPRQMLEAEEPAGADVLLVGDTVVVSAAAPRTAAAIAARGFPVETVDISELEKLEAGPTCLSVLLPAAAG